MAVNAAKFKEIIENGGGVIGMHIHLTSPGDHAKFDITEAIQKSSFSGKVSEDGGLGVQLGTCPIFGKDNQEIELKPGKFFSSELSYKDDRFYLATVAEMDEIDIPIELAMKEYYQGEITIEVREIVPDLKAAKKVVQEKGNLKEASFLYSVAIGVLTAMLQPFRNKLGASHSQEQDKVVILDSKEVPLYVMRDAMSVDPQCIPDNEVVAAAHFVEYWMGRTTEKPPWLHFDLSIPVNCVETEFDLNDMKIVKGEKESNDHEDGEEWEALSDESK